MQHYTNLSIAQRAAILNAVRQSLGLALDDDGPLAAFAEALAFGGDIPGTFMLAEAIDSKVCLFDAPAFNVDPAALIDVHGHSMVALALQMACLNRIDIGARTIWRKGDAGANDPTLKLPSDLLARWFEHYP